MARLLARILAVLALWLPLASHGLGLGEITLRSALNQPLEAEIALLALRPDEADSVTVKLASNATFEQSGVERIPLHSELRFKLQQKATGDYYIRVYTQPPVKEPFVNFLVEINWSAGRLMREYTVLLDPPTLMPAPAPRIQAPLAQNTAPPSITPSSIPPASVSTSGRFNGGQSITSAPPNNYTQPRDTLWSLAQRLRPDASVSTQQMMLALLKANPDAFFENNINSLKSGYRLRVPDLAEINALSAEQALREVKQHNAAWANRRSQAGAGTATDAQDRLKLVAAATPDKTAAATADSLDEAQKELSLANEAIEAKRQETEDLQSRLSELEGQVESMQKLLTLKDESLANLQNKLEEIQPGAAAEAAPPVTPVPEEELQPEPVTATPEQPTDTGFDIYSTLQGLQDEIQNNLTLQALAGIGALLLIALLWLLYRRRRVNATTITEDDIYNLRDPVTETLSAEAVADAPLMDSIDTDAPEAKAGARSPLAEVDVYLAYEQYPQAESLLRQLIAKEPGNHQLKLRLLELFFLTKNKAAFGAAAENLHTALAGAPGPLWSKALDMGQQLYPTHPLFAQAAPAVAPDIAEAAESTAPEPVDTATDTDFELEIPAVEPPPQPATLNAPLDFDFSPSPATAATTDATTDDMADELVLEPETPNADFDLELTPVVEPPAPVIEETTPSTPEPETAPLEFTLEDPLPEAPTTPEPPAPVTSAAVPEPDNSLDFDFENEAVAMAEAGTDALLETDDEPEPEIDTDFDTDTGDDPYDSADEVATKLDLARAYLDMGDEEGATSIIAEVLEEGNAAQKQEARDLMSNLTR